MDISSISAVLTAIGVLTGVTFGIIQLRNLARTRYMDLLLRFYEAWYTKDFQAEYRRIFTAQFKDYDDYMKRYGWGEGFAVTGWFELLGIMLRKKYVDLDFVYDFLRHSIKLIWEKMQPVFEGYRKVIDDPTYYEHFEYLYNEIKQREKMSS